MLRNEGVSDETIDILVEEEIRTVNVFTSLGEEHFRKLLPKMKVGHHALLIKLWDKYNSTEVSHFLFV